MRWFFAALAALLVLPSMLVAGLWFAVERGWLNGVIEAQARETAGIEIELQAPPDIGWTDGAFRIEVGPASLAAAAGGWRTDVQDVAIELPWRPLLSGEFEIRHAGIARIDATVVAAELQGGASPEGSFEIDWNDPLLQRLVIESSQFVIERGGDIEDVVVEIDELRADWPSLAGLQVESSGSVNGEPLTIATRPSKSDTAEAVAIELMIAGGNANLLIYSNERRAEFAVQADETLRELLASLGIASPNLPAFTVDGSVELLEKGGTALDLVVRIDETRLAFDGRTGESTLLVGNFASSGPNPGPLLDRLNLPSIAMPPFDLRGHIELTAQGATVDQLQGQVGDSDVDGRITVDWGSDPVTVEGVFRSKLLDLDDLFPLVGVPPRVGPGETATVGQARRRRNLEPDEQLFPTARIDPKDWKGFNINLDLYAAELQSRYIPFDSLEGRLIAREGWLTFDPIRAGVADGRVVTFGSFDTTQRPPALDFDMRIENLHAREMLAKLDIDNEAAGTADGRVQLRARGYSVADMVANADGQAAIVMSGGRLDALLLEALGFDIFEGLIAFVMPEQQDAQVPIRCAVLNFDVADGVARTDPVIIDTRDSKVTAQGSIDIGAQTLDLLVQAHPKDASLLSGNQPIQIEGAWLSPAIAPAPGGVENNTLGWLLAPLAAIFPFFDLGLTENAPCQALLQEARDAAAVRPQSD